MAEDRDGSFDEMKEDTSERGAKPAAADRPDDRTLLVVDDDAPFRQRLALALERRGYVVTTADSVATGIAEVRARRPAFAVIDLRLGDGSGIEVVSALHEARADARAVVLTGYGNIATAVAAVKMGAIDYLSKPADADAVEAALLQAEGTLPPPPEQPMTADRVRWEHIQRVFEQCDRNVSETARRLRMHRRTLQRILNKYAPKA
jgi:two-component system response regulator RegA